MSRKDTSNYFTCGINNVNFDITIRQLKKSELYDGMMVQSIGNLDHIYKLKCVEGTWMYQTYYRINGRANFYDKNEDAIKAGLKKDDGSFEVVEVEREGFKRLSSGGQFCETIYSKKFNLKDIREDKLKELGI
jgi:hypothetical protein